MARSRELDLFLKDNTAVMHDFMKYLNVNFWRYNFGNYSSIRQKNFVAAKNDFESVVNSLKSIQASVVERQDVDSAEFKKSSLFLGEKVKSFEKNISSFRKSKECPKELAAQIGFFLPSFRMLVPLSRAFAGEKPVFRKTRLNLKQVVEELQNHLKTGIDDTNFGKVDVRFRIRGNPVVFANKMQLQRAMFNIFHDAVTHSHGEPVVITIGATSKNLAFATTNIGRKLKPEVIALIGNKPYSTDVRKEVPHGIGKVAAKETIVRYGGNFLPKNAARGFRIQFTIPLARKRKRAA